jgi:hypothetical protein
MTTTAGAGTYIAVLEIDGGQWQLLRGERVAGESAIAIATALLEEVAASDTAYVKIEVSLQ